MTYCGQLICFLVITREKLWKISQIACDLNKKGKKEQDSGLGRFHLLHGGLAVFTTASLWPKGDGEIRTSRKTRERIRRNTFFAQKRALRIKQYDEESWKFYKLSPTVPLLEFASLLQNIEIMSPACEATKYFLVNGKFLNGYHIVNFIQIFFKIYLVWPLISNKIKKCRNQKPHQSFLSMALETSLECFFFKP